MEWRVETEWLLFASKRDLVTSGYVWQITAISRTSKRALARQFDEGERLLNAAEQRYFSTLLLIFDCEWTLLNLDIHYSFDWGQLVSGTSWLAERPVLPGYPPRPKQ